MPEINLPTKGTQDEIKTKVDAIQTALPTLGKKLRRQVFENNGTFAVPAGVTQVFLTGGGGGGGGGGHAGSTIAGAGGTTTFGTLKSLIGGARGNGTDNGVPGASGGPGGTDGERGTAEKGGHGGSAAYYQGGYGNGTSYSTAGKGAYCSGGGGSDKSSNGQGGGGGGAGDFVINFPVSVTPGSNIPITIGIGGKGGNYAGDGGNGILTVEWWG